VVTLSGFYLKDGSVMSKQDKKEERQQDRQDKKDDKRGWRLDLMKEKTQLMVAKGNRWKWLAIVLGLIAAIAGGAWMKFGGLF